MIKGNESHGICRCTTDFSLPVSSFEPRFVEGIENFHSNCPDSGSSIAFRSVSRETRLVSRPWRFDRVISSRPDTLHQIDLPQINNPDELRKHCNAYNHRQHLHETPVYH